MGLKAVILPFAVSFILSGALFFSAGNSRVFLLGQLWIVKSWSINLSIENINNGASVVFKTKS